mmetsp:Transcript_3744/g.4255  ORF Transcript_3744/g.4255 Transcript_3744/m.4255 type:complete len:226 (+) Transcript_3744:58-735(+)
MGGGGGTRRSVFESRRYRVMIVMTIGTCCSRVVVTKQIGYRSFVFVCLLWAIERCAFGCSTSVGFTFGWSKRNNEWVLVLATNVGNAGRQYCVEKHPDDIDYMSQDCSKHGLLVKVGPVAGMVGIEACHDIKVANNLDGTNDQVGEEIPLGKPGHLFGSIEPFECGVVLSGMDDGDGILDRNDHESNLQAQKAKGVVLDLVVGPVDKNSPENDGTEHTNNHKEDF